jgi:hypothetical protein
VHQVEAECLARVEASIVEAEEITARLVAIPDRRERFKELGGHRLEKHIMALAVPEPTELAQQQLFLRAWREAMPEPLAPFQRSEDIA